MKNSKQIKAKKINAILTGEKLELSKNEKIIDNIEKAKKLLDNFEDNNDYLYDFFKSLSVKYKKDIDNVKVLVNEVKTRLDNTLVNDIKVTNWDKMPTISTVSVDNLKEFPESFSISNLAELKEVKVENLADIKFPESIEVKKPAWYKQLDLSPLLTGLTGLFDNLIVFLSKHRFNVDLEEFATSEGRDGLNSKKERAIKVVMINKDGKTSDFGDIKINQGPWGGGGPGETNIMNWDEANIEADIEGANSMTIYNTTMTLADTEYSRALPTGTKKFMVKNRGLYDIKLTFSAGASGTTYITIPAGMNYWEDLTDLLASNRTLYFQCATAAQVCEIIAWTRA